VASVGEQFCVHDLRKLMLQKALKRQLVAVLGDITDHNSVRRKDLVDLLL
jgi:hypothetical protein